MNTVAEIEDDVDPVRTCAGCRQRDAQEALLRFAIAPGEPHLVPDPRRRLPGRGVSVHPTRVCIARAVERGGFAKALRSGGGTRGKIELDTDALCAMARAQYEKRLEGLLLAARRSHSGLAIGTEAVRRALDAGTIELLFVAKDGAGRRDELMDRAAKSAAPIVAFSNKADLGRLMGRDEVSVMAILDAGIAQEVAATAARATQLSEAE